MRIGKRDHAYAMRGWNRRDGAEGRGGSGMGKDRREISNALEMRALSVGAIRAPCNLRAFRQAQVREFFGALVPDR